MPFVHITKQSIDEQNWASEQGYECAEIKVHAILRIKVLKINRQVHVPPAFPSIKEVPLSIRHNYGCPYRKSGECKNS